MRATVFWPWSSNVILPTIEFAVLHLVEDRSHLLAVGSHFFDRVEDQVQTDDGTAPGEA